MDSTNDNQQEQRRTSKGHVDSVLDRYLASTESRHNTSSTVNNKNIEPQLVQKQEYLKSLKRLEEEQRVAKMIGNMENMNDGGFWWDVAIDNMDQDELEAYKESMQQLKKNVVARLDSIEANNASPESRMVNPYTNIEEIPAPSYGNSDLQ
ncbi:unnamed protein product [Dovyalis caffra]|uniref:Mads box protein n=1 Tax=Dovyalis caffra TaxID=77055 RepID=A0AAV1S3I3_9ROSI|nr:unnamed protein product [Dovyalis caffra]